MLDGLAKLTPAEQAAAPKSNTQLKKERNRLAARTPTQVRKDALIEERQRLKKLAKKADADKTLQRLEDSAAYSKIRQNYREHKKISQKRKRRSRPNTH